jgi:hypothetical protein
MNEREHIERQREEQRRIDFETDIKNRVSNCERRVGELTDQVAALLPKKEETHGADER